MFYSQISGTQEFVYPVAQLDETFLLLMYQRSGDELELLLWNRSQKSASKELSSMFIPSSVQLLPSKKAFSFIDRGRIRIKTFSKRQPRAIDIFEPITNIISMTWLTDELFYFVGQCYGVYSIFLCDISQRPAKISTLCNMKGIDCLYPNKIENKLFYIAKNSVNNTYAIYNVPYCSAAVGEEEKKLVPEQLWPLSSVALSSSQNEFIDASSSLCFLRMEDDKKGFVIEFIGENADESLFLFRCFLFSFDEHFSCWTLKSLFDFSLSSVLLIGNGAQRLYESIYPLLPRYEKDWIYFTSYDTTLQACRLKRYNRAYGDIESLSLFSAMRDGLKGSQHTFCPIIVDDNIYSGISFNAISTKRSVLESSATTGEIFCDLPIMPL